MKGLKDQIWVTSAVTDDDVEKALIFCYSLKQAYTSRKIAVIASQTLSTHMRDALDHGFDFVFYLDENKNTANLKPEDFAKLYSILALKSLDNCVYVSPYMLALKNCDDIFSTETNGVVMVEGDERASIFLFKPSADNYMALTTSLVTWKSNGSGIGKYLKTWMNNQFSESKSLDKIYNIVLTQGKALLDFENNISMVNLLEYSKISDMEALRNTGILGNLVGIHWSKIRMDHVSPLIEQLNPKANCTQLLQYCKEPIAIVGMSCRYPGSNNLEEFWNLLVQGQDATSTAPPFRWMREQCSTYSAEKRKTNAGFLKMPVDEFDAKFFGISPKEVLFMDPQHRLLHELVWEGLEDACVDPHKLRGTSGSVFLGSWTNDYKDTLLHSGNSEFYRGYMGNSIGAATARLSFLLGLTGPSIATESGCSSSMVAVHMACRSLQNGETNLAIAGGVNLLLNPFDKDTMPMVLSPDGHCKTFSEDANGFARAEGCGVLVLKRLSDALKDSDNIWAIVRGSAVTQEGVSNSMGTPTVYSESLAMKEALKDARVRPEDVSYVEAHGTGTAVGDPMEVTAIAKAYHSPARKTPLVIGSVKTNVGHTESCSGITGIMKVVLGMHHETIPAHQNFTKINPSIDLEAIPAVIPLESVEWKKCKGTPRLAGVSSFGITGTDAHMIIEESPVEPAQKKVLAVDDNLDRPVHLLKLSAKTEEALDILLAKCRDKMQESPECLADIAFSYNCGRANFPYRAAITARTKDDAISCIDKRKYLRKEVGVEPNGKICFLFTGQGSQYPGMAKLLYDCSPVFQMHFDYCNTLLEKNYNISLKQVLWSSNAGSDDEISRTIYSQTSIFCVEYALLKLWESWGVKPDYALGHSLGEFAAAVCAGIISVEDAIKLVSERSKLIDDLPRGKMLVIQADHNQVENAMKTFACSDGKRILDYAAINSSSQTVVAGDSDVVMEFSEYCTENKIKCIVLAATHAFHSKHMDPMLEKYRILAKTIKTRQEDEQTSAYISGMRGDVVLMEQVDVEYWVQHTREKVNFLSASKKAVELGCKIFIEIGPQPVLSALTMLNNDNANLMCLPSLKRREDEWETMLNTAGKLYTNGVEIDWSGIDQFYNRKKVRLPHYPFIGKKVWPDLMQRVEINAFHPLIGSLLPNASSVKIFQNGVNLSTHAYIKDHAIGQTVVFPGAGFLEMCVAAGLATVEGSTDSLSKPVRPMKIENLMIKAPLALQDSQTRQLQTVVELNKSIESEIDWNDMTVKIFHRDDTASSSESWLEHAIATFSPLPTAEELLISFDVEHFRETLLQSKLEAIDKIYDKLNSLGLKFGPVFRSLEKVWRNEQSSFLLAKVKVPENSDEQSVQYIVHPVILDAMIQAIMMLKLTSNTKTKLYVPIRIGKYLWISNPSTHSSNDVYIQVYDNSSGDTPMSTTSCSALLLDSNGKIMAFMTEVEFIDTTVKAVEAVLEQQTSAMPDLWEETWSPSLGPSQHRHDLAICRKERFYDDNFLNDLRLKRESNEQEPHRQEAFANMNRLVYLNFLRCLYECGWVPVLDTTFTEKSFIEQLGIQKQFRKMLTYILQIFKEEGILQTTELAGWKVGAMPPSAIEIEDELSSSTFTVDLVKAFRPTLLLSEIGKSYSRILKGAQSALPIVFPEDPAKYKWPPIADFYTDYGQLVGIMEIFVEVMNADMKHCKAHSQRSGQKNIFRILEVGAGTGPITHEYLKVIQENNVDVEYTFTDTSTAFFPAAEKTLESYLKSMTFKKLNIEEDPVSQGFTPNYYDYVIANDVIHATKNLSETLTNVRMLLRPNGKFLMGDQTKKSRVCTYLFGSLDDYWRFNDIHLRPDHCTLSTKKWMETLQLAGFDVLENFPSVNNYQSLFFCCKTDNGLVNSIATSDLEKYWLLFHQDDSPTSQYLLHQIPNAAYRTVITVRRAESFKSAKAESGWTFEVRPNCEEDFVQLMDAIQRNCGANLEGILYTWSLDKTSTTQDSMLQPYFHMTKSFMRKNQGASPKIISLVNGVMPVENNESANFHSSTIWGFTRTLKNERMDIQCRCIDIDEKDEMMGAEQVFYELWSNDNDTQVVYLDSTRYTCRLQHLKPNLVGLKLPNGSDRFQLILPETKTFTDLEFGALEQFVLKEDDIEVQVKASALNFKDIFNILKPSDDFKDSNAVGFDFAGSVRRVGSKVSLWSVGDKVFGLNVNGDPLPSHIQLHEKDVLPIPDELTFPEACTLPAVVATSYHCLIEIAKITAADTVLIHAATGGVGLSAIQICKNVGATIIATAGSKRKQNYLRSLGIKHIFHSRNTQYGDEILTLTNGRGVDVVLNSLTSEGFKEATLRACAKNSRFVEMSKLSIWQPEEVKQLRPDIQYTIVDLSSMDKDEIRRLMRAINNLAGTKAVTPITYVRFDAVHIREALQYLQKAKHIGKVICIMPEFKLQNDHSQVYTSIFNESATYLITGGLGGIGYVVCEWMVEKGAKHIVLAGRSLPSEKITESINYLRNEKGVKIAPVQLDVSNLEKCKELIEVKIPEMGWPRLKGVMHAAGTLQDGLIENQTWEKLSSTFKTKVDGTMNLHELTKHINLEHFVMFSSVAATFGSPGQCNHAAGNTFEDTFAHYRHSIGLPATTVNWGQWGEVGIATEVDLPGLKALSNLQGTTGLEFAIKSQRTQTNIFNIESFVLLSKIFPQILQIVDERVWKTKGNGNSTGDVRIKSDEFWQQYDMLDCDEAKTEMIREELRFMLRNILKLEEAEVIEDNANFQEMGVDSLMFVELKNAIQCLLGTRATLNVSAMKDYNTVSLLADVLNKMIGGEGSMEEDKLPTADEVSALIKEDCQLPESIIAKPQQIKVDIKDVSKILLTGCSGTLGPYILKELSNTPQITEIICLMRTKKQMPGEDRLSRILQDRELLSQVDMTKVRCVNGDVALHHIGMKSTEWEELCNSVDAVFHSAAKVSHTEHYRQRNSKNDGRAVNVQGTKNILEFACTGSKLKHVYCASSLVAVVNVGEDGRVSEDWPKLNDYDGMTTLAYPITKFVGDVLMKQAVLERGIPGKVFRFPLIVGDSKTGRFVLDQNHVMLRYMFILQQGMMPSTPFPLAMLPVDICAWASVQVFFNPNAPDDLYNVSNITPAPEQEFVRVAERLGYKVDIVEYGEFNEKIRESTPDDSPFAMFKDFYRNDDDFLSLYNTMPVLKEYILSGGSDDNFMVSKKIAKVLPEFYVNTKPCMDHIYRDMLFAKSQGWFKKFNLI